MPSTMSRSRYRAARRTPRAPSIPACWGSRRWRSRPASRGRGGCWFASGGISLHLGVEDEFRPARKAHPAFLVDGLADLVGRCRAAGAEVVDDEGLETHARAFVFDPFGNRIELMEPRKA